MLPQVKELAGLAALDKEHGQREREINDPSDREVTLATLSPTVNQWIPSPPLSCIIHDVAMDLKQATNYLYKADTTA